SPRARAGTSAASTVSSGRRNGLDFCRFCAGSPRRSNKRAGASGPVLTFASHCGGRALECYKQKNTSKLLLLVELWTRASAADLRSLHDCRACVQGPQIEKRH